MHRKNRDYTEMRDDRSPFALGASCTRHDCRNCNRPAPLSSPPSIVIRTLQNSLIAAREVAFGSSVTKMTTVTSPAASASEG